MRYEHVIGIVRGLNAAGAQYLIVGGLAVNAHGFVRMTVDLDLLVGLESQNLARALPVFRALKYVPRAPVALEDFADAAKRDQWRDEKKLTVFSLFSAAFPETEIDLFVHDPLGFTDAAGRAQPFFIAPGVVAPVCCVADLIRLKMIAARPKDMEDIRNLKRLHPENL